MDEFDDHLRCEQCWQFMGKHDQKIHDETWLEYCENRERQQLSRTQLNAMMAQESEEPMARKKKKLVFIDKQRCTRCNSGQTYGRKKKADYWCRMCNEPFTVPTEEKVKVK